MIEITFYQHQPADLLMCKYVYTKDVDRYGDSCYKKGNSKSAEECKDFELYTFSIPNETLLLLHDGEKIMVYQHEPETDFINEGNIKNINMSAEVLNKLFYGRPLENVYLTNDHWSTGIMLSTEAKFCADLLRVPIDVCRWFTKHHNKIYNQCTEDVQLSQILATEVKFTINSIEYSFSIPNDIIAKVHKSTWPSYKIYTHGSDSINSNYINISSSTLEKLFGDNKMGDVIMLVDRNSNISLICQHDNVHIDLLRTKIELCQSVTNGYNRLLEFLDTAYAPGDPAYKNIKAHFESLQ